MSHSPLRSEKDCLNCGSPVEQRFCPKCGQENVEIRPKFHHLISHFFADLFHYDSGFWKTMKTLLFKPGIIVREYLNGKRKSYVEPVKLYIFVSFIAFFLPHILPEFDKKENPELAQAERQESYSNFEGLEIGGYDNVKTVKQLDSIQTILPVDQKIGYAELAIYRKTLEQIEKGERVVDEDGNVQINLFDEVKLDDFGDVSFGDNYRSISSTQKFDSIHNALPQEKRMNKLFAKLSRKFVEFKEVEGTQKEIFIESFKSAFVQNLPKALFVYLPIFAFFLWLIHGKKKWLYYDHGIFTLYFFSALLIFISFLNLFTYLIELPGVWWKAYESFSTIVLLIFNLVLFGYIVFYFFRAHHRVYAERAWISRLKCFLLLIINSFLLFILLMIYTILTFMII